MTPLRIKETYSKFMSELMKEFRLYLEYFIFIFYFEKHLLNKLNTYGSISLDAAAPIPSIVKPQDIK